MEKKKDKKIVEGKERKKDLNKKEKETNYKEEPPFNSQKVNSILFNHLFFP